MSWGPKRKQHDADSFLLRTCCPSDLSFRDKSRIRESLEMGSVEEDSTWVDVFIKKPKQQTNNGTITKGRLRSSGKRSLNSIAKISPPERDPYHGGPQTRDREEEKRKLINLFCGVEGDLQQEANNGSSQSFHRNVQERDVKDLLKDQIDDEISDRIRFLNEIDNHHAFKKQIEMEIETRLKELQKLT